MFPLLLALSALAAPEVGPVTVRVDLRGTSVVEPPVVLLYGGGGSVTEVRPADDGAAPDEVAGDGVYTGTTTVPEAKLGVALRVGATETRGPKVRLDPAAPGVLEIAPRGAELDVRGGLELEPLSARPNAGAEGVTGGGGPGAGEGPNGAPSSGAPAGEATERGPGTGVLLGVGVVAAVVFVGVLAWRQKRRGA